MKFWNCWPEAWFEIAVGDQKEGISQRDSSNLGEQMNYLRREVVR
jgi:hypothetical protein